ncbi:kinase-like protein, partial [Hortaea werneckii]
MFSLGLLIVALYNTPHTSPLKTSGSLSTYKRTFSSSSTIPTQHNNFHVPTTNNNPFPPKLATDLLPRLITRRPAQRLTARAFQEAAYFDNILVSTIRFLDALPAKTPQEKAAFMRGLPRIMPQFPKSVLEKKVLPALLEEMKDRELLAPILTCVFAMVQAMPTGKRAFEGVVAPKLREVFLSSAGQGGGKHGPSQNQQTAGAAGAEKDTSKEAGLMVLLENMSTVATHCDGRTFREDIFPILLLALDASTTHGLVDAALGTLPVVLPVLDFSTIKNELFPVIAGVFAKTSSLAIKIRGLEAFHTLCGGSSSHDGVGGGDDDQAEDDLNGVGVPDVRRGGKGGSSSSIILDKFTVQEKVVPLLKGIKTKEPGVMMAALKVFRQVGEVADSEFLAVEVLPVLWHMSLGPLLNLQQFQAFMRLVKRLSGRIEREQTRKLQEMGGGNGGVGMGGVGARRAQQVGSGAGASNGLSNGEDADFETLVSGRKPAAAGNDDLMNDWGVPSTTPAQPLGTQTYTAKKTNDQPTFSWQTPSSPAPSSTPAPQQPAMNALRSGAQPAARTITPDQTLSSFASLTPQSAFSQPLQPTRTGSQPGTTMGSMPLRPPQHLPQQSSGMNSNGTSLDWSAAAATKNAHWTVPRPPQHQQRQMSGQGTNGFGATSKTPGPGFGLPPPPMSPQNVGQFGQPGGGQRQGSLGTGQRQQMSGSSSGGGGGGGLDRYESLI